MNSPNVRRTVSRTGADAHDAKRESASSVAGIHSGTSYGAESTHYANPKTAPCVSTADAETSLTELLKNNDAVDARFSAASRARAAEP